MRVEDEDTESGEQEPENDMDSGKMDAYELENESDACETGDKRECTSRIGTLKIIFLLLRVLLRVLLRDFIYLYLNLLLFLHINFFIDLLLLLFIFFFFVTKHRC